MFQCLKPYLHYREVREKMGIKHTCSCPLLLGPECEQVYKSYTLF